MSSAASEHKTIAIMQPYFFPYPGYFEIIKSVDLFVVLEDVQFPRRGWVHRNRFRNKTSLAVEWWGLPLKKGPQATTMISDLVFDLSRETHFRESANRLLFNSHSTTLNSNFPNLFELSKFSVVEYLVEQLENTKKFLSITTPYFMSSKIPNEQKLTGGSRLIQICKELGATSYINAPGGKELYDPEDFLSEGINLQFMNDFKGNYLSILDQLFEKDFNFLKKAF
jgi:hypothetical protein